MVRVLLPLSSFFWTRANQKASPPPSLSMDIKNSVSQMLAFFGGPLLFSLSLLPLSCSLGFLRFREMRWFFVCVAVR